MAQRFLWKYKERTWMPKHAKGIHEISFPFMNVYLVECTRHKFIWPAKRLQPNGHNIYFPRQFLHMHTCHITKGASLLLLILLCACKWPSILPLSGNQLVWSITVTFDYFWSQSSIYSITKKNTKNMHISRVIPPWHNLCNLMWRK